jgi:hypothetical protein
MKWQQLSLIIGIIISLCTLIGIGFKVDSYYAHAEELTQINNDLITTKHRLDRKILNDEIYQQTRMKWALQDRISKYPNDNSVKEQLNEIEYNLNILIEQKKLIKK